MSVNVEELTKELRFKTSRSGGAGGQNVNKVETKVTLIWDYKSSTVVTQEEKKIISTRLANRIQSDGLLLLDSSESRSQATNKEIVVERLAKLLTAVLTPTKKRIATKIPRSKILARLDRKAKQSDKKSNRRWRFEE